MCARGVSKLGSLLFITCLREGKKMSAIDAMAQIARVARI